MQTNDQASPAERDAHTSGRSLRLLVTGGRCRTLRVDSAEHMYLGR